MSKVAVINTDYSRLQPAFSRIFGHIGADLLNDARQIAIKINLCDYKPPETGATTHPRFLEAFLQWVNSQDRRPRVYVVESDATQARPDLISRWLGIDQIIKKEGAEWVNLSKDSWSRRKIDGLVFRSLRVPDTILRSDLLISMAKMKTHTLSRISCSLKNQFGCIMFPRKVRFHDFLDEAIVDACTAMKPDLAIVDGIIGMGGPKGPIDGVPIHAGLVVAGEDPVAVDSACARIMGLNPHRIGHLKKAETVGLGSTKFEAVGDGTPLPAVDFETNETYRRILQFATTLQRRSITWG
jgi:uncharacterized protein (DUF362 family)